MKETIRYAKELVRHGKVKQISETMFDVEGYSIKLQKKSGRLILLCSCKNSSLFADNNFCSHKTSVIIYLANKNVDEKIDKLIDDYQRIKDLKMKIDTDIIIDDLSSLKRVK